MMAPNSEKDLEKGTSSAASTAPDIQEKEFQTEKENMTLAHGVPDLDHDAVEHMDSGHMEDLRRKHSTDSIKTVSIHSTGQDDIQRAETKASKLSTKSKLSRIATRLTTRSKKNGLEREKIPVSDLDNGVVGWDSQDDTGYPQNFADSRKWFLLSLLSIITFISPLASSMFAPCVSFMSKDFNNHSEILGALTVSIFVFGYVIGPLILAPLSEIYGRRYVLTAANCWFCVWQIGCALSPNISALIAARFLAGIGGSGCLTIGGGVVADLFRPDQRGLATSLYSLGPLLGPVVGPVCGGFIGQTIGWRWCFWVLLIAASSVTIGIECFTQETNPRILIDRKIIRLNKELNRTDLKNCYDQGRATHSPLTTLKLGLIRPLRMLVKSPIVALLSIYMAVVYGLLYLLFTTLSPVFIETYQWKPDITGLAYIGLGAGFLLGLGAVAKLNDATVVRMTRANNGVFEPEMRLPACIFFACWVPITFFWYGWAAQEKAPWIVSVIGLFPFGFGSIGIFIPIQTYVIDCFPMYAASGLAALTVARSSFGAFLPLAAPSMYAKLHYGWGNTLLGFVAIALIPAPLAIYRYGGKIRKNYPIEL